MQGKTATLSPSKRSDGAQDLMSAVKCLEGISVQVQGFKPVPTWMDTDEIGEDGRLVAMPPEEKLQDFLADEREREQMAEEAEREGDHDRAAFERQQAQRERQYYEEAHERTSVATAGPVVRSNGTYPRRAESSGRPAVRGSSRRSSAKSGDSGDDGESSEPPPAGRPCECGCGHDVSHRAAQALYLNDQHAAANRQRRKRQRDLTAPALNGDAPKPVRCKCRPKGELVDNNVCVQCGRPRSGAWGFDAEALRSLQLTIRDLTRRKWRTGDGKRHDVEHGKVQPRRGVAA